jgi:hypothetical protein
MLGLAFAGLLVSCSHSSQVQHQGKVVESLYLSCEQEECMVISFEKTLPSDKMSVSLTVYKTTGVTQVPIKEFVTTDDGVPQSITVPSSKIGKADKHYSFVFSEKGPVSLYLWGIEEGEGCNSLPGRFNDPLKTTCPFHEVTAAQASQEIARALNIRSSNAPSP